MTKGRKKWRGRREKREEREEEKKENSEEAYPYGQK